MENQKEVTISEECKQEIQALVSVVENAAKGHGEVGLKTIAIVQKLSEAAAILSATIAHKHKVDAEVFGKYALPQMSAAIKKVLGE